MMTGKKLVEVEYHVSVRVPVNSVRDVKDWTERFGYLLGDGWAFNQNVSEWITIDGMIEYDWRDAVKDGE